MHKPLPVDFRRKILEVYELFIHHLPDAMYHCTCHQNIGVKLLVLKWTSPWIAAGVSVGVELAWVTFHLINVLVEFCIGSWRLTMHPLKIRMNWIIADKSFFWQKGVMHGKLSYVTVLLEQWRLLWSFIALTLKFHVNKSYYF